MVTNMNNWVVDFEATKHICGNRVHLLPIPRYPLELGVSISTWESRSEDLV
ncbi:hypothetical protein CK203_080627 [Vitis vinifera]|uniref:Uncharacterized protein n=1 Tax=Vitis vinifera TaxID=29760 RepID=A0A438EZD9_VITVI|nr:hypothetical protein CK203_080627 [Vitis vinifera]